jgi:sulfur relay (sulfurtransferase) DsrC/TusE family protein
MSFDNEETESNKSVSNNITETKQYLITDENFKLVIQCKHDIYLATEASPSIRKIINELITEENLQKVKSKFIAVWK